MNPTIVYRVENKIGLGMYTGADSLNDCPEYQIYRFPDESTFNKKRHPMPSDKMLIKSSQEGWLFAFPSIKALKLWLFEESWLDWLDAAGYEICAYEVDDIYKDDDRQCLFDPEVADLIEIINWSNLKEIRA